MIAKSGVENPCRDFQLIPDLSANTPPSIQAISVADCKLNENLLCSASMTDSTNLMGISEIRWSQKSGPGTITFSSLKGKQITMAFSKAGTYVVNIEAWDGLISELKPLTITVGNADLGTNYALRKPASATSIGDNNQALNAGKAVDGDVNSIWHPAAGDNNSWWKLDLKEPIKIKRIELVTRQSDPQAPTRHNFSIKVSNDEQFNTFTVLGIQSSDVLPYKGTYTLNVPDNQTSFRYIQVAKTATENHTIAEFRVFGEKATSVSETRQPEWTVFPNPVTDKLYIEADFNTDIEIFDSLGRSVYRQKFSAQPIETSRFPKGFLYVVLEQGTRIEYKPIIKM